jgi:hypothetical protein
LDIKEYANYSYPITSVSRKSNPNYQSTIHLQYVNSFHKVYFDCYQEKSWNYFKKLMRKGAKSSYRPHSAITLQFTEKKLPGSHIFFSARVEPTIRATTSHNGLKKKKNWQRNFWNFCFVCNVQLCCQVVLHYNKQNVVHCNWNEKKNLRMSTTLLLKIEVDEAENYPSDPKFICTWSRWASLICLQIN